jgi:hypothetical protein
MGGEILAKGQKFSVIGWIGSGDITYRIVAMVNTILCM